MANQEEPRTLYENARRKLSENTSVSDADKDAIYAFLDAVDPEYPMERFVNERHDVETKADRTLEAYCDALMRVAMFADKPLTEMTAEEVNLLIQDAATGKIDHPEYRGGKDGYARNTVSRWQSALSRFYQFHDDLEPTASDIIVYQKRETTVDDRDMYTEEEVEAMRNAVDNSRDRAMLELFLNTGQRVRALQTLRIKDIDLANGVYDLNTDAGGLKGADDVGRRRPLLGAKAAVREWLNYHPVRDDPESYLLTIRPDARRGTPGEYISKNTIRYTLKKIAEKAEVSKPPNPHNFRHYFVTVCKRDYGMDDDTIKFLIGHKKDSNVMTTTYKHLADDDHIKNAEVSMGLRKEEEVSPLTPPACPTCGEALSKTAKACSACGMVLTPDAQTAQDLVDELSLKGMREAKDDEEADAVEALTKLLREDKELAADVIDVETIAHLLEDKGS